MGMVYQLGKFSIKIAKVSSPLWELLNRKRAWSWGNKKEEAFQNIKTELTQPSILALYNPKVETKISADASSHGLGAILLQLNESAWQPVAYALRALTDTELCYVQIEKEAFAVAWSCERFSNYIVGKHVQIETDHKWLVPLLSCKPLENLPLRVVKFRLWKMRFDYSISHVPGSYCTRLTLYPDHLTRTPSTSQIFFSSWSGVLHWCNCLTTTSKW